MSNKKQIDEFKQRAVNARKKFLGKVYTDEILKILPELNTNYGIKRIYAVAHGRVFDLKITLALEQIVKEQQDMINSSQPA